MPMISVAIDELILLLQNNSDDPAKTIIVFQLLIMRLRFCAQSKTSVNLSDIHNGKNVKTLFCCSCQLVLYNKLLQVLRGLLASGSVVRNTPETEQLAREISFANTDQLNEAR